MREGLRPFRQSTGCQKRYDCGFSSAIAVWAVTAGVSAWIQIRIACMLREFEHIQHKADPK